MFKECKSDFFFCVGVVVGVCFCFFVFYKKEKYPTFQQGRNRFCFRQYRICQDPFNPGLQKYHKTSNLPLQSVNQTDPKLDLNLTLFSHLIPLVLHFFLPHSLLKQLT